jgi:ADP-ribose pyrophosphatase YjhB (NUDIX family)
MTEAWGTAHASRAYPDRPVIGVGAVVVTSDGRVVLVRRGRPPLAGEWSVPGGVLELGEGLLSGVAREVLEETGLVVDVGAVVDVFEHISTDPTGRVKYHYVVVDYLCLVCGGELLAASDALEIALADPPALDGYAMAERTLAVVRRGCVMAAERRR